MMTTAAIVLLVAVAAVARLAAVRTRAARVALRSREATTRASAEPYQGAEASSGSNGDATRSLNDLLVVIASHTEQLIAGLDPSATSIRHAREIQRAALMAVRITKPLHASENDACGSVDGFDGDPGGSRTAPVAKESRSSNLVPDRARGRTSVLVVDDDRRVGELIRLVLTRAGYDVVSAADPSAALTALQRQPAIALMLVDVVMPDMDGYDLAAELRKISPGASVVFMSGFAQDVTRRAGSDDFLAKPFTAEGLARTVADVLGRRESLPPITSPPLAVTPP